LPCTNPKISSRVPRLLSKKGHPIGRADEFHIRLFL
jgi:hypothetical protein